MGLFKRAQTKKETGEYIAADEHAAITGAEDHYGDMDFKVTGTGNGIDGNISEIAGYRVREVRDDFKEGQQVMVKCIGKGQYQAFPQDPATRIEPKRRRANFLLENGRQTGLQV